MGEVEARGDGDWLLPDDLAEGANVLLLADSMAAGVDATCVDLLTPGDPAEESVLFVSITRPMDDQLRAWRAHAGDAPASVSIVCVGDQCRSAAAGSTAPSAGPDADVDAHPSAIRTVPSPGDLTGLGIAVTESVRQRADGDARLVVCVDSLSTLLQYADTERVFRFLHVLTGRLRTAGAVAHYHLDPGAHDERTRNTLTPLFDAVVEVADDGEVTVNAR